VYVRERAKRVCSPWTGSVLDHLKLNDNGVARGGPFQLSLARVAHSTMTVLPRVASTSHH
jgi:hypothetical protein